LIKVEKVKKKKDPTKEETVCLANGLEVSKFENFKKSSQFLKEPLATELVNESDHFTNDAVQLLKFQDCQSLFLATTLYLCQLDHFYFYLYVVFFQFHQLN